MSSTGEDDFCFSPDGSSSPQAVGDLSCMPLHAAAVNGEKAVLRKLLQIAGNHADIANIQSHYGRTPLVYSVLGDRQDCAELLLKAGANVNTVDVYGMTALHYSANQGNHKCTKLLLSKGADWKVKNNEGRTPLHFAATQKSPKCLILLLKRIPKGEVDHEDDDCITPLHYSSECGNLEHVKLLLKAGASPKATDFEKKTALHWAATNENAGVIKLLLDQEPDVINCQNVEGRAAIHLAVAYQNSAVVKVLVSTEKCRVSLIDNMGRSPLHWAAVVGNSQIVSLLLQTKADYKAVDDNGATALHYAAQRNFGQTVELMLSFEKMGDLRDNEGRTALMWAAGKGADRALETMLRHHLDMEMVDKSGGTALHIAAYCGHVNCVQLLLQFGACVNVTDALNQSPLFRACERGHAEVVNILLEYEAIADLDRDMRSPLHWAARGGHPLVCETLLKYGVLPDAKDRCGRTPLHCAAYSSSLNCMALLIENGADVNAQDVNGNSALHWSCRWGHLEAVKLLVDTCNAFTNFKEVDGDRLTPLNYAILGDHQDVAKYMIEKGGLTITNIEDAAAESIQSWWRSYQVRKSIKNQKNLWKRHEQLKDIKKRTGATDGDRTKRAESFSSGGSLPAVRRDFQVKTAGSYDGGLTSDCEDELSPGVPGWELRLSESRPGLYWATNNQEATVSRSGRVNSTEESSDGDASLDLPTQRTKPTVREGNFQHKTSIALKASVEGVLKNFEELKHDNPQTDSIGKAVENKDARVSYVHVKDSFEDGCRKEISSEEESADFTAGRIRSQLGEIIEQTFEEERTRSSTSPPSNLSNNSQFETPLRLNYWSDFEGTYSSARNHVTTAEHLTIADRSERARKERERLKLFRTKINAAVSIQRCFRRHLRIKREFLERKIALASVYDEGEELTQEVAALTIQLAWRKHLRNGFEAKAKEKKADKAMGSCASLRPNSTGRIYSRSQEIRQSSKFGLKRMRKVTSSKVAPSAAFMSYNYAVELYHPLVSRQGDKRAAVVNSGARVRPHSMKRTNSGWTHDVKVVMDTNAGKRTRGGRK